MSKRLQNKTAIITGTASGLGEAYAHAFAAEGANVVCGDVDDAKNKAVVDAITAAGGKAIAIHLDVTSEADNQAAVKLAIDKFGGVDVFFANAGIAQLISIHEIKKEEWERVLAVHLTGAMLGCKAVLPHMMEKKKGSIILKSSLSAVCGFPGLAAYTAAKGAISALARQMAAEYSAYNIRVNAMAPGVVLTDLVRETYQALTETFNKGKTLDESLAEAAAEYPLGRLGTLEDVTKMAVFLASDDASWTTGQTHILDGGYAAV